MSSNVMADLLKVSTSSAMPEIGSRVRRGPDWMWDNLDGGVPGTIVGHAGE